MMMQADLVSSYQLTSQELITTVSIDEVHNRSAHSDYVLAPTFGSNAAEVIVRERIPQCQQLVVKGVMHHVKRCFLEQPLNRSANLLNQMAQLVITYHNERVGRPLIDETCHWQGSE